MSGDASPLMTALFMGVFFAGTFLFLLFMLWASGRSPIVRRAGELIANLFYLAGALIQAWSHHSDTSVTWPVISALLGASLIFKLYQFFKTRAHGDRVGPPPGSIAL